MPAHFWQSCRQLCPTLFLVYNNQRVFEIVGGLVSWCLFCGVQPGGDYCAPGRSFPGQHTYGDQLECIYPAWMVSPGCSGHDYPFKHSLLYGAAWSAEILACEIEAELEPHARIQE